MCLAICGLIFAFMGALALSVANLWLNPIQVRDERGAVNVSLVLPYKITSVTGVTLLAVGFLLQLIWFCLQS